MSKIITMVALTLFMFSAVSCMKFLVNNSTFAHSSPFQNFAQISENPEYENEKMTAVHPNEEREKSISSKSSLKKEDPREATWETDEIK